MKTLWTLHHLQRVLVLCLGLLKMEQQLISFCLMFPEELIEHIVSETNRYACECIAMKPDPEWKDTSLEEIKAFLGLHVLFKHAALKVM